MVLVVENLPTNAEDITDVGSIPGLGNFLEEGIEIHSSILAWRIPWTKEPGGLQSTVSQRIRHDWSDLAHTHTCSYKWRGRVVYLGKQENVKKKKDDWIEPLSPVCVDPAMHRAASNLTGVFVQIKMGTSSSEWIQCDASLVSKMWVEFQPPLTQLGSV